MTPDLQAFDRNDFVDGLLLDSISPSQCDVKSGVDARCYLSRVRDVRLPSAAVARNVDVGEEPVDVNARLLAARSRSVHANDGNLLCWAGAKVGVANIEASDWLRHVEIGCDDPNTKRIHRRHG